MGAPGTRPTPLAVLATAAAGTLAAALLAAGLAGASERTPRSVQGKTTLVALGASIWPSRADATGARTHNIVADGSATYTATFTNHAPTAVATADPTSGMAPLTVDFDGTGSSEPDPRDSIDYAWDLDDDGQYDDSSSPTPSRTYPQAGKLRRRAAGHR
jgi:hypothetical protein